MFSTGGLFIFSKSQYTSESFWEVLKLLRRYCVTTESASLIYQTNGANSPWMVRIPNSLWTSRKPSLIIYAVLYKGTLIFSKNS